MTAWRTASMSIFLLGVWIWSQLPNDKLKFVFCDVGQGDGAIVALGYFQALIDTGGSREKILDCLGAQMPFWDRKIEIIFISHGDRDHSGALAAVKKAYEIGKIVDKVDSGDRVRYGELYFEILSGEKNSNCQENDCSVVVRVGFRKISALFTGDISEKEELALVGEGVIKRADILKVAHHGSKNSSSLGFLQAVKPGLAIISAGAKNTYGHPSSDTLMRLEAVRAKIMRTDREGSVEVETDGERLWVKK